jgi:hypothetical protein
MKNAGESQRFFLYLRKFVVFEFQPVAHIDAEGQQGDGDFAFHPGIPVADGGIVATDVNNGTDHFYLLKNPPLLPGAGKKFKD